MSSNISFGQPAGRGEDWYAIHVNSNCERRVGAALRSKGYESFVPLCVQFRNWSNRIRQVERTLIPGYVFGRFDPERRLPILTIPGVAYIVGTRAGPVPVDPSELAAISKIAASPAGAEPWPYIAAGQMVTVENGPLRGLHGRLISANNDWRVVVSISLLQRSVAVEVDRSWIRPAAGWEADRCTGTPFRKSADVNV